MRKIALIGICAFAALAGSAAGKWVYAGQWGHAGNGPGEFNHPSDAGVNSEGNVYVTDRANHRVQYFTGSGQYLGGWGTEGHPFMTPIYVDFAVNGNVYIADWYKGIYLFSAGGSTLSSWEFQNEVYPWYTIDYNGLAVSRQNGSVYVKISGFDSGPPSYYLYRIYRLDSSLHGNFYFDLTPAWLNVPAISYSTINPWLYSYEANYGPIKVFSTSGSLLFSWGTYGPNPGSLYGVHDMVTNQNGDVYVVEPSLNRFQWFTSTGSFLGYYAASGSGDGQFNDPWGIGLSPSGDTLYIADAGNDRIQYFRWENDTNIKSSSMGKIKALFR